MPKVILQDSEQAILEVLEYLLSEEGFITLPLSKCEDVLDRIDDFQPDLAILDFGLTGKASIEACREIKSKYPDLPVIASSANYDIGQLYLKHGFSDYIEKPFDLDGYLAIINRHLRTREVRNV